MQRHWSMGAAPKACRQGQCLGRNVGSRLVERSVVANQRERCPRTWVCPTVDGRVVRGIVPNLPHRTLEGFCAAEIRLLVKDLDGSYGEPRGDVIAHTGQWDASRLRAPAKKKARASPDKPGAPSVPSPAAVLHAERMTQSASSRSADTSEAIRRPSSTSLAACGGVNTRPGSATSDTCPPVRPWVAKTNIRAPVRSAAFKFASVARAARNSASRGAPSAARYFSNSIAVPGRRSSGSTFEADHG